MPARIGRQAVVVGAGIAGLTAARALADFFERVIILENDLLPKEVANRPGTPQSKHLHGLLAGGLQALSRLFPDFEESLAQAGAVQLRMGYDYWIERPGYDHFPQREFGIRVYSMTRPLLEFTVRKRVEEQSNLEIRESCRALEFISEPGEGAVAGVRYEGCQKKREILPADLVIDASGQCNLTMALLDAIGWQRPEETSIGVDISYATAVFNIPEGVSQGWMGVFTFPDYPRNKRGALLLPVEGNRWVLTLMGRYEEKPPADWDGFLRYAKQLRTPTVYNAICRTKPLAKIERFGFKASCWRHFERLEKLPRGLLPFGDAICRFNPIYGQGMSVAALEAEALGRLLKAQSVESDGIARLAGAFFAEAENLIDTPWWAAAIPDFIDPRTEGQRPPDLEDRLKFFAGLLKLASQDATVHKLLLEVQSLVKPRSEYRNPELVRRVRGVMAESQTTSNLGSK